MSKILCIIMYSLYTSPVYYCEECYHNGPYDTTNNTQEMVLTVIRDLAFKNMEIYPMPWISSLFSVF